MLEQINIFQILSNRTNEFGVIVLLFGSGLFIRVLLQLFGQIWIKTKAHTVTLLILPIITYVITNVITGNIALSLGMVGALSIVRFRHPVRSPLELSVYFGAITMGIAASVNIFWLLFLVTSITFVVIALVVINFITAKVFKNALFIVSFSEGNSLSTLTIISPKPIDVCETNDMLQSKIKTGDEVTYTFASPSFYKLRQLEENKSVQIESHSIQLKR